MSAMSSSEITEDGIAYTLVEPEDIEEVSFAVLEVLVKAAIYASAELKVCGECWRRLSQHGKSCERRNSAERNAACHHLRSKHIGRGEAFILIDERILSNCALPRFHGFSPM